MGLLYNVHVLKIKIHDTANHYDNIVKLSVTSVWSYDVYIEIIMWKVISVWYKITYIYEK